MEDPSLDAREAQPYWAVDATPVARLIPAAAGMRFDLWALRGPKRLGHDGQSLIGIVAPCDATGVRFRLPDELRQGDGFAFAVAAGPQLADRIRAVERFQLRAAGRTPKPSQLRKAASDHMARLVVLDALAAGLSRRDTAGLVFGRAAWRAWGADPRHRSNLRYLIQRAEALRDGGYRTLVGLPRRQRRIGDETAENRTPPFSV